ncbi:Uncharacterised protein [Serratia plymuthica]|nr:Uncharacterised protein [Serratia plymuthica]
MLEVTAEATRNPVVAKMLSDAETRLFRHVCQNLQRMYPHSPNRKSPHGWNLSPY